MTVVVESADGEMMRTHSRGMFIRRSLGDGVIAVSVSPSGQWDDPEEYELARGVPTWFVNQWGYRVGKVGNVTFWEEIEDFPEIGDPGFATIQPSSRVTVRVVVH